MKIRRLFNPYNVHRVSSNSICSIFVAKKALLNDSWRIAGELERFSSKAMKFCNQFVLSNCFCLVLKIVSLPASDLDDKTMSPPI